MTKTYKEYGTPDEDLAAYNMLLVAVLGLEVRHILHHPRKPLDAKMCQKPGSLLVQAVLADGRVISIRQLRKGEQPRIVK